MNACNLAVIVCHAKCVLLQNFTLLKAVSIHYYDLSRFFS